MDASVKAWLRGDKGEARRGDDREVNRGGGCPREGRVVGRDALRAQAEAHGRGLGRDIQRHEGKGEGVRVERRRRAPRERLEEPPRGVVRGDKLWPTRGGGVR